jgi:thymidylate synthase
MNNLDKQYTDLLQDILDNGTQKSDRTGTGTLSIFGRQIRHKMSDGFPLLTTKKMPFRLIATELLWFLRGDSDIRFLWENNCTIWDGDWYKQYKTTCSEPYTLEEVKQKVKDGDHHFHDSMFDMGPIYGKQWRGWEGIEIKYDEFGKNHYEVKTKLIDQIANLIHDLKTNPDSRRLMVNAWNVGELDSMVLPPCHYGFQVYTRELSREERIQIYVNQYMDGVGKPAGFEDAKLTTRNIPTRAISLMWNQRSVDTFLGLPFNIASYGLLLEIIAKAVNMVPDELIGNLGDTHLYLNHVEQAKEQIGRELTLQERHQLALPIWKEKYGPLADMMVATNIDNTPYRIPTRTREPYPLPTLNINTEWWPTESGECGVGPIDAQAVFNGFTNDNFCKCLLEEDLQLSNYQAHPHIKAPLSN